MEFKKGDRFEVFKDFKASGKSFIIGDILTVLENRRLGSLSIECSRNIDGHDCGGLGKRLYCWNIYNEDFHIVEESSTIVRHVCREQATKLKPIKRLSQSEFAGKLNNLI